MPTAGVLTVSDRCARGERQDGAGPRLCARLSRLGFHVGWYEIVPDEPRLLVKALDDMVAGGYALVVTTGGTGLGPRDRVPDVLDRWADGSVPGLGERMRAVGAARNPRAVLSRGGAWFRGRTLVVAVPGSPAGAEESLDAVADVIHHAVDILAGGDHPPASPEAGGPHGRPESLPVDG